MGERVVLCYGDSNTHGTAPMATLEDLGRLGPAERWPGVLAAELGAGWRVIEEGLPGRTTVHPDPVSGAHKSGIAVLPAILESHRPIDLVAIMLGTNDFKARFQVPPVEIADSIERLVLTVRTSFCGPGAGAPDVLAICPPPVLETGRWYCLELLVDLGKSSPDGQGATGQLNFWIDGVAYGPWTNLWLRSTDSLQLNLLKLALFHHEEHSVEGMLLDEVMVSTQPIGKGY